jgi:xylulokinase
MARDVAVGFDVGTTAVKVGLLWLDANGPMEVIRVPYPTTRPHPGWAEQDPEDWVRTMAACWAGLTRRVGPVRVRSVGLCSQVNTHVLVDASLRPTYPAITWQDTRTAAEAAELDARVDGRRAELWGGPFTVDASFSLSRLAWLARHEPDAWRSGRWMLSPKDYCLAALCGEVVTDPISPIGLVGPDDRYLPDVVALVPGADQLIPPLRAFDAPAGVVSAGNRVGLPEGVPVAVGTMDAWANVYGSGLVRPGLGMVVSGTSEIVAVVSDESIPTRGVISFPPVRGKLLHAGGTQAGGAALDWAAALLSVSVDGLLSMASDAMHDPQPIVFLPYLAGERAPLWDPGARGMFLGLTTSTERRHLALAVLEGVAFSVRHLLGECERAAGGPADELRLSGGGARSTTWNQVQASVVGRPLTVLTTLDSGVLGAALMGMVAAGLEPDLVAAADRRVTTTARVDPDPGAAPRLDDLYGVYRDAYPALAPVLPRLTA